MMLSRSLRCTSGLLCGWFLFGLLPTSGTVSVAKGVDSVLPHSDKRRRRTSGGDLKDLNRLLEGAVLRLPDQQVSSDLVDLWLTEVRCTNFVVDQVYLASDKVQGSAYDTFEITNVELSIEGLDMVCFLDWRYTFLFTRDGSAILYSYDNQATFEKNFRHETLGNPVTSSWVEECAPDVNVNELNFDGDISTVVFDTVVGLMRSRIEALAEDKICDELNKLSQTQIAEMLREADKTLADFFAVNMDPLQSEIDLDTSSDVKLMDLRDELRTANRWLDKILTFVVDFTTQTVTDSQGNLDMNLNVFIRESFLQDGALVLETNLELFRDHNRFVNATVALNQVKIIGLDQIKTFEPFNKIGRYTVQNKLSWDVILVELDISLEIQASTREDSVFESPNTAGTQEKIKITFGVQDVQMLFSILLAVDENKLGALRLGSLMFSDRIVDCLLSSVHDLHFSGLSLQIGDVQPPIMTGFVARGIDRVVSDLVDASFLIYESAMLKAAPGFFQTVARDFVNKKFAEYVKIDVSCFIPLEIGGSLDGFVDFRDLLLPPDEALAVGGMGTVPYGDLLYTFVSELKERFLSNDENGIPKINGIIANAFQRISPSTDSVVELGDLLDWNTTVTVAGFEGFVGIRILDASIGNLDSFGSPLELFEPVYEEANMLNNSISIGVGNKTVYFAAEIVVTATDYGKASNEYDEKMCPKTQPLTLLRICRRRAAKQLFVHAH